MGPIALHYVAHGARGACAEGTERRTVWWVWCLFGFGGTFVVSVRPRTEPKLEGGTGHGEGICSEGGGALEGVPGSATNSGSLAGMARSRDLKREGRAGTAVCIAISCIIAMSLENEMTSEFETLVQTLDCESKS